MLSDEEKEAIKNLRLNVTNVGFSVYDGTTSLFKMRDIQIVLNLIEKQSKEIEELNYIKRSFDYCVEQENKKWEDKIKAKIEYCREILYSFEKELELKANKDKFIHKESMNCLLGQISILQSLLEKE